MNTYSIRSRISLTFFITTIFTSIVLFGSFYYATMQILKSQTDREITLHAQVLIQLATLPMTQQTSQVFAQMPGMLVAISDANGDHLFTSQPITEGLNILQDTLEKSANIIKPVFVDRKIGTISMRLGIFPVAKDGSVTGLVLVAHPVDVITKSLNSLIGVLIILIVVISLPATLTSYYFATTYNSMLTQLNESLNRERQFIGDVAHELKTPLATLKNRIEVALSKFRNADELKIVVSENLVELNRLSATVNDVLDLAWAQSGEVESQFISINLTELIGEVRELLENLSSTKKIQVVAEIEPNIFVSGVRQKLFRAIYNLIDNAVKFTSDSGKIALSLRTEKDRVILEVSNTGLGIAKPDIPYVFKRFYRGKSNSTEGTGLGLSICKSIIEAHHGSLNVSSTPKKITTFTVNLPIASKSS